MTGKSKREKWSAIAILLAGAVLVPAAFAMDPCPASDSVDQVEAAPAAPSVLKLTAPFADLILATVQEGLWMASLGAAALVGLPFLAAALLLAASDVSRRA